MQNYVYIEFLIEDQSGSILVTEIMRAYKKLNPDHEIEFKIKFFKGLGKIPEKVKAKSHVKTGKILNDLPLYLKGIGKSLANYNGEKAIFVIMDTDQQDCAELKKSLVSLKQKHGIDINVHFCLAIEEMEAWLLGDEYALQQAYPNYKRQVFNAYIPDSIIGTWELLADVVYPGGHKKMERELTSYYEKGLEKGRWAEQIGQKLNILNNSSPSFNYFISKLDLVCGKNSMS
ncbi:DUF4276 family protein [Acetobacterium wieringae]|uniref:DUF4276 family protein n=1 Tax=Acetobacterium wieringae TaxID=52694 RepID=UPI0020332293|nr:DUF4276 family protein [Acetobacterium wieringae]URN83738.1 DUF4276 family protein [Acetobacterium wieringae]